MGGRRFAARAAVAAALTLFNAAPLHAEPVPIQKSAGIGITEMSEAVLSALPDAELAETATPEATEPTISQDFAAFPLPESPIPLARPYVVRMPDLRWEDTAKGDLWTRASMKAISSHGQRLVKTVPQDISNWCPGYKTQDAHGRASFWAGLLSTLSYHESTWRETAVGGGGLWYGLVQIAPPTARWRNCKATTGTELKDGVSNLNCAVRIMNVTVPRDQVVSQGMRGVAADWGPFHSASKREDMRRWISDQPFCRIVMTESPLPILRPSDETEDVELAFDGDLVPETSPITRPF